MIKKLGFGVLSLMLLLGWTNRELLSYGYMQAKGQLSITVNTRPVVEVLADTLISESIKQQINIVQEARAFAFDSLGLTPSKNYTTFYDQKGEVALWNLSGSAVFALEPKLWSFPFLGSFPYKGFFDLKAAQKELELLQQEGYEGRIRPVGGWSTLGWTTDPILSSMLERNEGSLAELIIHELTHGTLFVKDNVDFNENLASFIGEKGAIQFLNGKYGQNSEAFFEYTLAEEDAATFRNHMLLGTEILDSLYKSFVDDADSMKQEKKKQLIDEIISSLDTLHFHNPAYYSLFDNSRPNNAYFMSFIRYYSAKDSLNVLLSENYDDNLRDFIEGMIQYHK